MKRATKKCPTCKGKGWFGRRPWDPRYPDCSTCGGTGEVSRKEKAK